MVRFWPFGGDDNSPDSFERALSKLASQIQTTSFKLAGLRQRSRRYKALFTISSVTGYILFCIVVVLVIGRKNVGLQESGGLIGAPIGIYLVRRLLDLYYGRRISSTELRLEELQLEQRSTIEKLKTATKYSTTQSLIEKYGGTATGVSLTPKRESKRTPQTARPGPRQPPQQQQQQQQQQPRPIGVPLLSPDQIRIQQQLLAQQRAGIPPQSGQVKPVQPQPQSPPQLPRAPQPRQPTPARTLHMQGHTQPPSRQHLQPEEASAPKWYDRFLDVVLGEDETSANNRFALICKNCRMVNGLAPPGTRSLDEMDEWGCARCGVMNGGKSRPVPVAEVKRETQEQEPESEPTLHPGSEPKPSEARMTRSRAKREEPAAEESDDSHQSDVEIKAESEDDEPETPKPKPKARARGRKKA